VTQQNGPPKKGGPDADNAEAHPTSTNPSAHQNSAGSRQVSFWSVHQFVEPLLTAVGTWPMAGSVEWCLLDDDDPVKVAALYDAAQHWALHLELNQEARAEASKAVSGAADWPKIAREIQEINNFRASRPWATRVAS